MATKSQDNLLSIITMYSVVAVSFNCSPDFSTFQKQELIFCNFSSHECLASLAIFLATVLASANVSALLKASLAFQARAIF